MPRRHLLSTPFLYL
ncbi:hypothetical protein E2C01_100468 [Portunus trituberculatus]|uniref:Uncharacterized protein n=1 Tax=Portunus trituberculatus TaxID=210409 RepID=A0A5B7K336_PORTR|nr:hypothetical protein [Portunus trituberculatus]